jgi:predicted RNase H-like HicB family nuclease
MRKFLVIYEKTKTGFSAYAPDLPGVIATGKTRAMAKKNIYEGILFHLDGMKEENLRIPVGKTQSEVLVF